ncbi:Inosine triphosphate pyrophosphatase [Rasamsonia emersonii CBS 393.64]|uniref:XTP/dITP diphosphatase n=1 Tax=Rasamsonia emersonii (strain ATCC 16479 / CBS 393.64 / IMI 116815) TaxID=1408163 RepID=A0A0F4Z592_RASE3|nr:Inosine triphosphate pyrophosphatase [Rasamsonia emersonii CBS 393.64]KKA25251.1 Inosine triphosphate pyrophosphatase [Rasamsonia emersonii CBS 393.64]
MAIPKLSTITFITSNRNKIAEVTQILGDAIKVEIRALDLPEIQGTTEEIAREKCRRAAIAVNGPVLVEDSSLEFHALNGLPGPYIKWFYSALGNDGLNNLLAAYDDKSATAVCTFAFSRGPGVETLLFQGRNTGRIVPKRGSNGFGALLPYIPFPSVVDLLVLSGSYWLVACYSFRSHF